MVGCRDAESRFSCSPTSPTGPESVRPRPLEHRGDGLEQNRDVAGDGPVLDVGDIGELGLLLREVAAPGDLPRTGDAGLDEQTGGVERRVLVHLVLALRAGTDHRHVALEDIEELGDLVNRGLADKMPDLGDARVFLELERGAELHAGLGCHGGIHLVGVDTHGTELVHGEWAAIHADARLGVQRRAAVLLVHLVCGPQHERRAEHDRNGGEHDITHALEDACEGGVLRELRGEHRHQRIIAQMQGSAADIGDGCGGGQFDAHGFDGERQGACRFGVTGQHVRDQHGAGVEPLGGQGQMGVEGQDLELRLVIIGRSKRHRNQILGFGRIILIAYGSDRAHGDGRVSETGAFLQLLENLVDALGRADHDGGVVELPLAAVAVQCPTHEPALNEHQHERHDGDADVQRSGNAEMEQISQRAQHDEVDESRVEQLGVQRIALTHRVAFVGVRAAQADDP